MPITIASDVPAGATGPHGRLVPEAGIARPGGTTRLISAIGDLRGLRDLPDARDLRDLRDLRDTRVRAGGVDLVDLDRLRLAVARSGAPLVERVLTPTERRLVAGRFADFAAAFGIKESVIKTIGGFPRGAGFHDIELSALPQPGAAPVAVTVRGAIADWAERRRVRLQAASEQLSASILLAWAIATSEPAGAADREALR